MLILGFPGRLAKDFEQNFHMHFAFYEML